MSDVVDHESQSVGNTDEVPGRKLGRKQIEMHERSSASCCHHCSVLRSIFVCVALIPACLSLIGVQFAGSEEWGVASQGSALLLPTMTAAVPSPTPSLGVPAPTPPPYPLPLSPSPPRLPPLPFAPPPGEPPRLPAPSPPLTVADTLNARWRLPNATEDLATAGVLVHVLEGSKGISLSGFNDGPPDVNRPLKNVWEPDYDWGREFMRSDRMAASMINVRHPEMLRCLSCEPQWRDLPALVLKPTPEVQVSAEPSPRVLDSPGSATAVDGGARALGRHLRSHDGSVRLLLRLVGRRASIA